MWYADSDPSTEDQKIYAYSYNAYGQLYRFDNLVSKQSIIYEYDINKRLVSFVEFDTEDASNSMSAAVQYNEKSQITRLSYYLQSRYYGPVIGRFLNADIYISTGQGLLGYNMFAYCGNNPINRMDSGGHAWYDNAWNWIAFTADDVMGWVGHGVTDVVSYWILGKCNTREDFEAKIIAIFE